MVTRGRQVDVKVGPHREGAPPQRRERPASRVEARKEQPSPSEFESPRLHQNSTAVIGAFKSALGMTTLGEVVPEKIDWLEEESDGTTDGEVEDHNRVERTGTGRSVPVFDAEHRSGLRGGTGMGPTESDTGFASEAPVVTPVYESIPQEVERRVKEVMDREPESDEAVVRSNVTDGVKKLRRQKALEAEGSAREEAPDYDTGSQEVRRGRRKR